jgi:hypothetical protein
MKEILLSVYELGRFEGNLLIAVLGQIIPAILYM